MKKNKLTFEEALLEVPVGSRVEIKGESWYENPKGHIARCVWFVEKIDPKEEKVLILHEKNELPPEWIDPIDLIEIHYWSNDLLGEVSEKTSAPKEHKQPWAERQGCLYIGPSKSLHRAIAGKMLEIERFEGDKAVCYIPEIARTYPLRYTFPLSELSVTRETPGAILELAVPGDENGYVPIKGNIDPTIPTISQPNKEAYGVSSSQRSLPTLQELTKDTPLPFAPRRARPVDPEVDTTKKPNKYKPTQSKYRSSPQPKTRSHR